MLQLRAGILSIGDELTLGQGLDTNSQWIAQQLVNLGITPIEHATIADDLAAHARCLRDMASRCDVIISSGGLGPTADDLTREAIAQATGDSLVEDESALQQIEAWFSRSGRTMNPINRVQACRPSRGRSIENPHGTAPGVWATVRAGPTGERAVEVFCLPGPPREMKPMFEASVRPHLRPDARRVVRTLVLPTIGLGESEVAARLGELMRRDRAVMVGTTASKGVVSIRVRYEGPPENAQAAIDEAEHAVRTRLGDVIFKHGEVSLAAEVLGLLTSRGLTIATIESCTGGLLGAMLTEVPGASAAVLGGFVTYSNAQKTVLVGVPESIFLPDGDGAVSAACASAMAQGGLRRTGADVCAAITGIAGPEGGSAAKPVGTVWIAVATRGDAAKAPAGMTDTRRFALAGDRANIREWACVAALAMVRQNMLGLSAALLREQERLAVTPST